MPDAVHAMPPPTAALEALVEAGVLTREGISEATAIQGTKGGNIFDLLIGLGHLDPVALHGHYAREGYAGIDLDNYECDEAVVDMIDEAFARTALVLPVDRLGSLFTIAMVCPLDTGVIEAVKTQTGLKVKPVVATHGALLTALDRYYAAEESTDAAGDHLRALFGGVSAQGGLRESLPSLPALPAFSSTVRRLQEAMGNPKATVRHVAEVIRRDPQVSARMLSVTNSAAYGMPESVTDIALAAVLLGKGGACEVAMQGPVAKDHDPEAPFDFRLFWRRSLFGAEAGQRVATWLEGVTVSEAYTAGLLHAIGRLAMAVCEPEAYKKATGTLRGLDLAAAERRAFGMDYAEAGALLAKEWALPASITQAIALQQEAPATDAPPLALCTALAARMADAFEGGAAGPVPEAVDPLVAALGVPREAVDEAYADAAALLQKS